MYNTHIDNRSGDYKMKTCRIKVDTKPISVYYTPLFKIGRGRIYTIPYRALWTDISLSNYYPSFLPINFK